MKRPAYLSHATLILRAIRAGKLTVDDRLPTHHEFAFQLGIIAERIFNK